MKKYIFLLWLFVSQFQLLIGQGTDETIFDRPMGNFSNGNSGGDPSNGTMNFTLPLIGIGGKTISTQVTLAYTSGSGVLVSELPSMVGLGFNLFAGGSITRQVRGVPDETIFNPVEPVCTTLTLYYNCPSLPRDTIKGADPVSLHYLYGWFDKYDFFKAKKEEEQVPLTCSLAVTSTFPESELDDMTMGELVEIFKSETYSGPTSAITPSVFNSMKHHYLWNVANGTFDSEPDIFTFSSGNYSCSFVFNPYGTPVLLQNNDFKILPASRSNDAWKIIAPDGTKFVFENNDQFWETMSLTSQTGYPNRVSTPLCGPDINETISEIKYISKWYLTSIESIFDEKIVFEYNDANDFIVQLNNGNQIKQDVINLVQGFIWNFHDYETSNMFSGSSRYKSMNSTSIIDKHKSIKSINFLRKNEYHSKIDFIYSPTIIYNDNQLALEKVLKYDYNHALIEGVEFDYSTFGNGRLKLNGIKNLAPGNTSKFLETKFEYIETYNLPTDPMSPMQDYWGYFNGETSNNNLISQVTLKATEYPFLDGTDMIFAGANREPNFNYSTTYLLNKIIYPHNGYKLFEYEQNEYYDTETNSNLLYGGVRIKKNTTSDGLNSMKDIILEYQYTEYNSTNSSGQIGKKVKMYEILNYHDYLFNSDPFYSHQNQATGLNEAASRALFLSRTNNMSKILPIDNLIYSRITKLTSNNGYEVTEYTNHTDYPDVSDKHAYTHAGISSTSIPYTNYLENDCGGYITSNSHKRGLLIKHSIFNESNEIVKETNYEYEFVEGTEEVVAGVSKNASNFFLSYPNSTIYNQIVSYPKNLAFFSAVTNMHFNEYYTHSNQWYYLKIESAKDYTVGTSDFIQTNIEITKNRPSQIFETKTINSDSKEYITRNYYPDNLEFLTSGTNSNEVTSLKILNDFHVISYPIEVLKICKIGSTEYVTNSTLTTFDLFNGKPLKHKSYALKTSIGLDDYELAEVVDDAGINILNIDVRMELVGTNEAYDLYGNVVRSRPNHGTSSSIIYGHNNTLPVAVFNNASVGYDPDFAEDFSMDGKDCSYTGFEDPFKDGWDVSIGNYVDNESHSGTKSAEVSSLFGGPNMYKYFWPESLNRKFILTCWVKTTDALIPEGGKIVLEAVKLDKSSFNSCYIVKTKDSILFENTNGNWVKYSVIIDGNEILGYTGSGCIGSPVPITEFGLLAYVANEDPSVSFYVDDISLIPTDAEFKYFIYDPVFKTQQYAYDSNGEISQTSSLDEFGRIQWITDKFGFARTYIEYTYADMAVSGDMSSIKTYSIRTKHTKTGFLDSLNNNLLSDEDFLLRTAYLDGLGRPVQEVNKKLSPEIGSTTYDMVNFIEYDNLGRSPLSYLPYTDNSSDGSFKEDVIDKQETFYSSASMVSHDDFPFAETIFDTSPLNRVIENGSPGEDWQISNQHTTKQYNSQNAANSILFWEYDELASGASATSQYPEASLFKSTTTDEDNKAIITFTDKVGRLICLQTVIEAVENEDGKIITSDFTEGGPVDHEERTTQILSTYYVYNDLNQLVYTIPPIAVLEMDGTYSFDESDDIFEKYMFSSKYDNKGRTYKSKQPGIGWEEYVYDQLNRIVLTRTPKQSSDDTWNFVKYDGLGRSVISGLYTSTNTREELQDIANTWSGQNWEKRNDGTGHIHGYTNNAFPELVEDYHTVLIVNYFDNYEFNYSGREFVEFNNQQAISSVRGLQTGSKVKILNGVSGDYLLSVQFYDQYYRPIQSHTQHHLDGWDIVSLKYDFNNQLISQVRIHEKVGVDKPLMVSTRFDYDHAGRVLNEYNSVGFGSLPPEKLVCNYEYNLLGQVIRKNLDYKPADDDFLQHIDYRYNIRGWLTSINNAELTNDGDKNLDEMDVFGEEIYYNNTTALTIDNTQTDPFVTINNYNGNITAVRWKTKHQTISSNDQHENLYAFRYDGLNQMTAAYFAKSNLGIPGLFENNFHDYDELVSYDMSGNIVTLNRKSQGSLMDELNYNYDGNKAESITDNITSSVGNGFFDGNTTGSDYIYDLNGSVTEDLNKGLTFGYNHLNLVTQVSNGTDDANYLYDALGRKLRIVYPDATVHHYVSGIEYKDSDISIVYNEHGRVIPNLDQDPCASDFKYEYFINDHLGNVRAVITRDFNAPEHHYVATLENANLTAEDAMFSNVSSTQASSLSALAAATSSTYSAKLNPAGEPIGPAKALFVQKGDRVSINVKSYFQTFTGTNSPRDVDDILDQLANFFIINGSVAPPGLETSFAASTFTSNSIVESFLDDYITSQSSTTVIAFLGYLTIDKDFNLIETSSGIIPVTTANSIENMAIEDILIPEDGFIYIFVQNESPLDVYFDNLHITHKKSNVLEINEYYPYGLKNLSMSQASLSFDPVNSLSYQSKEQQDFLGLNTFDFGLRQYDATIGRWNVQDPYMQFFNAYIGMGNNPVSQIDPNGGISFTTQGNPKSVSEMLNSPEYAQKPSKGGGGFYDGLYLSGSQLGMVIGNDNLMGNTDYDNSYFGVSFNTYYQSYGPDGKALVMTSSLATAITSWFSSYGLDIMTWKDNNNSLYLTKDKDGNPVPHYAIYDKKVSSEIPIYSNWNGEYRSPSTRSESSLLDDLQTALDVVGIADPTGLADATNALIYTGRGQLGNASISAMGIIPYIGDLAKAGKYGAKTLQLTTKARTAERGLEIGERFLGPGYKEIAPGVFRSTNELKQFRMTDSDILGKKGKIGPHFHFEFLDDYGNYLKNYHMPIK
ncbi:MAG: hypothetical protein JNL49_06900 [Bacteroidia bacterium]|nr:hypothetical protein [Bacteroidia bacterium]